MRDVKTFRSKSSVAMPTTSSVSATQRSAANGQSNVTTPSTSAVTSRHVQRSRSMRSAGIPSGSTPTPIRRQLTDLEMTQQSSRLRSGRSMTSIPVAIGRSSGAVGTASTPAVVRKLSRNSWESRSMMDSDCDVFTTEPIARNGTTFSARCNKYVVHCAKKVDHDSLYLTPTQRSSRDLRRLKMLLERAQQTVKQRDAEITRLKAQLMRCHCERSASSDQLNVSISSDSGVAPNTHSGCYDNTALTSPATLPSVADSGNYDCMMSCSGSGGSKESVLATAIGTEADIGEGCANTNTGAELEERLGDDWEASERWIEWEEKHLREEHERQMAEMSRQHMAEYQEMKETYNNKIETMLHQLSEANDRYYQLRPIYDEASLRVRQLELELAALRCAIRHTEDDQASLHVPAKTSHTSSDAAASAADTVIEQGHSLAQLGANNTTALADSTTTTMPPSNVVNPAVTPSLEAVDIAITTTAAAAVAATTAVSHMSSLTTTVAAFAINSPATMSTESSEVPTATTTTTATASTTTVAEPDCPDPDSVDLSRQMALLGRTSTSSTGCVYCGAPCTKPVTVSAAHLSVWAMGVRRMQKSLYDQQLGSLVNRQGALSASHTTLQMDPLMRLQFLRSAVYHLLTDRVNHAGHVTAIGAVLQFSDQESRDIESARLLRGGSLL